MLRLDTKAGIIVSGCASIAFAITYLALMDDYFWRHGMYEFGIHISGLQILASLGLIVGAVKNKHKFFVPWMITTAFFMYLMGYVAIASLVYGSNWVFVPTMIVPFTVFLGYALYSVQIAFDRMRKEEPPAYTNLDTKKDFVNHI
ncbi:uncharacterized protein [Drosophila bipectinata]|uniref:uncharacterized protein n=1 Tax=Drosophila bipectinata TaxID=42026 RepID=UPI001C8ABBC6|nr:uncharacterized protein LOC108123553 [Drosophila bipectinata]